MSGKNRLMIDLMALYKEQLKANGCRPHYILSEVLKKEDLTKLSDFEIHVRESSHKVNWHQQVIDGPIPVSEGFDEFAHYSGIYPEKIVRFDIEGQVLSSDDLKKLLATWPKSEVSTPVQVDERPVVDKPRKRPFYHRDRNGKLKRY